MTVKFHLGIQELTLEFLQLLEKAYKGKEITVEINLGEDKTVSKENFEVWRNQFMLESASQLNKVYSEDEPKYSENDLITINPTFKNTK